MTICPSCGVNNIEGANFCVRCGATFHQGLSWRGEPEAQTPPFNPPVVGNQVPNYPPAPYQRYAPEPIHPALPCVISLMFPGMGLLFVPNMAMLGIVIFVTYWIIAVCLGFFGGLIGSFTCGIGFCLLLPIPFINVMTAIHSYDKAARNSNGRYEPILFKGQ